MRRSSRPQTKSPSCCRMPNSTVFAGSGISRALRSDVVRPCGAGVHHGERPLSGWTTTHRPELRPQSTAIPRQGEKVANPLTKFTVTAQSRHPKSNRGYDSTTHTYRASYVKPSIVLVHDANGDLLLAIGSCHVVQRSLASSRFRGGVGGSVLNISRMNQSRLVSAELDGSVRPYPELDREAEVTRRSCSCHRSRR